MNFDSYECYNNAQRTAYTHARTQTITDTLAAKVRPLDGCQHEMPIYMRALDIYCCRLNQPNYAIVVALSLSLYGLMISTRYVFVLM